MVCFALPATKEIPFFSQLLISNALQVEFFNTTKVSQIHGSLVDPVVSLSFALDVGLYFGVPYQVLVRFNSCHFLVPAVYRILVLFPSKGLVADPKGYILLSDQQESSSCFVRVCGVLLSINHVDRS